MKNRNSEPRFDGQTDPSGALPQDLEDRLRRFREASGLTWSALGPGPDHRRGPQAGAPVAQGRRRAPQPDRR